jgi:hypothetical protein
VVKPLHIYNIYKVDPHYLHLMFASSFHNEPHHLYYFSHQITIKPSCGPAKSFKLRVWVIHFLALSFPLDACWRKQLNSLICFLSLHLLFILRYQFPFHYHHWPISPIISATTYKIFACNLPNQTLYIFQTKMNENQKT